MRAHIEPGSRVKIGRPELVEAGENVEYRAPVEMDGVRRSLWYRIPKEYGALVSDRADAALTALLIRAMETGEAIEVEGAVSPRLLYSYTHSYQSLVHAIIPYARPVAIHAATVHPSGPRPAGVALGFSAGIDSFHALRDHFLEEVPVGFRITHLLFNNVGSHGPGGSRLFWQRAERVRSIADRLGLPFVTVDSNLDDFYPDQFFRQTAKQRNASVGHLLQGGVGRLIYAAGPHARETAVRPSVGLGIAGPILMPLLSTDSLDVLRVGEHYQRSEKTLQVAEIELSHTTLDVCARSGAPGNCGVCWKCRRTMLTLEIGGVLDRYGAVFPMEGYRRGRIRYIAEVLDSKDPRSKEIVALARARGFRLPLVARLLSRSGVLRVGKALKQQARRLLGIPERSELAIVSRRW